MSKEDPRIRDMHEGDLFYFANRACTLVNQEGFGLIIQSTEDGWQGSAAHNADRPCTPIDMPKNSLELLEFIRQYQIKYDERLQQ